MAIFNSYVSLREGIMIMSIESLLQHADNMLPTWKQLFQPMPLCPVTPEKKLEKTARLNWQKLGLHQKSSKREVMGVLEPLN